MAGKLDEWLNLVKEEALEPGLPICDPHHHLWDYPESMPDDRLPAFTRIVRHYLLDGILNDAGGGHNIVKTVFIECNSMYRKDAAPEMRPVGEVQFVQGVAAQSYSGQYGNTEVAAGIVGFADLTLGQAVCPVLEAEITASRNRFRGIRFITTYDPNDVAGSRVKIPGFMAEPQFREGFSCLQRYGLSFDAWLYHTQIADLVALANEFPETPIILDHIGGPLGFGPYLAKRGDVFEAWKKGIEALSKCPNVMIKLGGLGMPRLGFGWSELPKPPESVKLAKEMAPYLNWCIEKFGVNRCMFESNFPVDKVSYSYTVLWNAFKLMTGNFSAGERAALFHDTAVKAYRLT